METIKNIIGMNGEVDANCVRTEVDGEEIHNQPEQTETVESVESVETVAAETELPDESRRLFIDGPQEVEPMGMRELNISYEAELAKRNQQDSIWKVTNNPEVTREDLNRVYTSILTEDTKDSSSGTSSLKRSMLRQIHSGDMSKQGRVMDVPIDFHKGPFLNAEDEYQMIFEAESENKIRGNCNAELIKTIGDTEVTYGMKAYAEGVKWNNGLICFNKNNIVVRNADNNFGQPGFLCGFFYYDRLAVEIMERYVVTDLISKANRREFTIMTDPVDVRTFITERYRDVRTELEKKLENPDMTETLLFADAPVKEELNAPLNDSEIRVAELENKVRVLEEQVKFLIKRLEEVEDIALDAAITRNERAIDDDK